MRLTLEMERTTTMEGGREDALSKGRKGQSQAEVEDVQVTGGGSSRQEKYI